MAIPRKLTAQEVAALVGNLMEEPAPARAPGEKPEVRPYAFGTNDLSLLGDYYALRMINERFCRMARSVFLPMLRFQPRISPFPPEVRTFDDYRSSQDNFVSLTNSRVEELRGNQLIVLPPSFVSSLTDAYYGGAVRPFKAIRNEFTATEQRVIEIVTQRLNQALEMAWRDLMKLSFTITAREENMQFAAFIDGDDHVVNCSFLVQMPGMEPASFDILYPLQTLKPISSALRSRMHSDSVADDRTWRDKLEQAVMNVPLQVSVRLCQPEIALRQLMSLQEGDVIPVQLEDSVEMLVEGRPVFAATPGEVAGQSAISILRPLMRT